MHFVQCTWHKPYAKQKMNIRTVYGCHLRWLNKCSAVAEMGDRLATIDMGRKLKGAVPLLGAGPGSPCNTIRPGPRPTFVPSGILIHPAIWPQQTWAEIWRLCPLPGGSGSASSTMFPRPMPTIAPSGILIHPAVWPQQT